MLKEKIRLLEDQIDANVTSINSNLNNIYYETSKIKSIDHNLVVLQEEMAQFHTEEMPALQQETRLNELQTFFIITFKAFHLKLDFS